MPRDTARKWSSQPLRGHRGIWVFQSSRRVAFGQMRSAPGTFSQECGASLIGLASYSQTRGVSYDLRRKQWNSADGKPLENFVRRANLLSRFLQGAVESVGGCCRAAHVRPSSTVIQFWTQCLAVRIHLSRWERCEMLLRDQQAHLRTVQAVRGLS